MARIVAVEILMIDLPPKVQRVDAIQSFVSQETPMVRITDADGHVGTGYSYTIGTGGPAIVSLLKETLAPKLLGRDAEEINGIWHDLLFTTHATAVGAITSLALATIDTALWDLRCRRAGLPLWKLAGGVKKSVPLYSTEGGWLHLSTEALVADAIAMKSRGFSGSKFKIGKPSLAEDRTRIRAVREAVGDDYLILVDANQAFSLAEARRRAAMLAEFDVFWFEEPMPADDVGAHRELASASEVPIAVGESMYSLSQFKDYLVQNAASVVQADVARVGGITPWLKIAHLAESFNVPICPHFLMELHVSLVCAVPNAPLLEYIPQLDDVTKSPMKIEDGKAIAPDESGLGIDWDWSVINSRIVEGTNHILKAEA
ncbi:mandelate racemase/muconate lactonizing enzyme family protein [Roseibium sediminis]|uniref:mandelate racemase/muconate lactonizing enzyme family protein n=1 Tax=Roseibium sediminis TaxID=1775174 RepID=UPI00123E3559|nr:mandelate racemase/muconate lactonizing enzyme family protein [Roseibium sediminis]